VAVAEHARRLVHPLGERAVHAAIAVHHRETVEMLTAASPATSRMVGLRRWGAARSTGGSRDVVMRPSDHNRGHARVAGRPPRAAPNA
jgi:hypothetical protein